MLIETPIGLFNVTCGNYSDHLTWTFTVKETMKIGGQTIPPYTWFATDGKTKCGWGLFALDYALKETVTNLFVDLAQAITPEQQLAIELEGATLSLKLAEQARKKSAKKLAKAQKDHEHSVEWQAKSEQRVKDLTARIG